MSSLGGKIRERMEARGDQTVMDASKRTGVSYAAIHAILSGKSTNPKRETLEKIARAYGTTVDWLLRDSDEREGTFAQGVEYAIAAMRETLSRLEREFAGPTSVDEGGEPSGHVHDVLEDLHGDGDDDKGSSPQRRPGS